MSETTNTAMDVGENIGARVLSSAVIRPAALEQGEERLILHQPHSPKITGKDLLNSWNIVNLPKVRREKYPNTVN